MSICNCTDCTAEREGREGAPPDDLRERVRREIETFIADVNRGPGPPVERLPDPGRSIS